MKINSNIVEGINYLGINSVIYNINNSNCYKSTKDKALKTIFLFSNFKFMPTETDENRKLTKRESLGLFLQQCICEICAELLWNMDHKKSNAYYVSRSDRLVCKVLLRFIGNHDINVLDDWDLANASLIAKGLDPWNHKKSELVV